MGSEVSSSCVGPAHALHHRPNTGHRDELTWLPAWRIRELIGSRELSPIEVFDHFLGRIEELNPKLKAFSYLDPGAREQAKLADKAVQRGDELGPLHGIPTSVKKQIAVAGMPRTDLPFPGFPGAVPAERDHFGVERLRKAGAIVIGTNTMYGEGAVLNSEAGIFESFDWEQEARNPWDTSKLPGWSSSGSAAAAAARMVPFAIASDGAGSTRLPAALTGIVGVNPGGGLVPNVDYDAAPAMLGYTVGPMAHDVRDAAMVTQVMAGPDGRDPFCLPFDPPDCLVAIDAGIEGMRFAWTDDFGFASAYAADESPRVIAHVRDAATGLVSIGASVEPTTEAWEDWREPLEITGAAFGAPSLGPAQPPTPRQLEAAFAVRARNFERCRRVLRHDDLLLSPTLQLVARSVDDWPAAFTASSSHTGMASFLRLPAVSVPCGFVDGLPVGMQIMGLPGSEDRIFRAAHAFQAAFPRDERPPTS